MSALDEQQREVAGILFSLAEAEGFALAGGAALLALEVIHRPTKDIDAFREARPGSRLGTVFDATDALVKALEQQGWVVTVHRRHETFARLHVAGPLGGVEVDLAVDSPRLFPIETVDGLPVLSGKDLAARKILAILDRAEGRDFTDLRALEARYSKSECVQWALALDPGLTRKAIGQAFGHLDRLLDSELPTAEPETTRAFFSVWQGELLSA